MNRLTLGARTTAAASPTTRAPFGGAANGATGTADRLVFLVAISLVYPLEIRVPTGSTRPEKTVLPCCRIPGCLECPFINPFAVLRVAVGKTKRTVVAMRNSKWIHPAGRDVHHPGTQILIARILLLNEHHGHGCVTDFSHLCEIRLRATRCTRSLPSASVHRVRLGVTHPCPKVDVATLLGALISRAVIHPRAGAILSTIGLAINPAFAPSNFF